SSHGGVGRELRRVGTGEEMALAVAADEPAALESVDHLDIRRPRCRTRQYSGRCFVAVDALPVLIIRADDVVVRAARRRVCVVDGCARGHLRDLRVRTTGGTCTKDPMAGGVG